MRLRRAAELTVEKSKEYIKAQPGFSQAYTESKIGGSIDEWWLTVDEAIEVLGQRCDHGLLPMIRCEVCSPRYIMARLVQKILARAGLELSNDEAERFAFRSFEERP
jgi:hypothetical protein